jgi:hypothetical protein
MLLKATNPNNPSEISILKRDAILHEMKRLFLSKS